MPKQYDAVIIGAGVGGLSAAAKLVHAGLHVLVLERNLHPGGTAYVYKRKGFTFPMGPLGFSAQESVRNTLASLGQAHDLDFRRVHYEVRAFGVKAPLSLPFEQMGEEMASLFPAEAQGVRVFFHKMDRLLSAMESPHQEANRMLLERAAKTSAHSHLRGLISDWRLRRILGSLGTRKAYTGLPLLAAMWRLMTKEGIWYPKGGMESFCQRLTHAVTGPGERNQGHGEVRLGAEVREIRISGRRALGVTLADDTRIDGAAVVSNADYKTTFMGLVRPETLPQAWYRQVTRSKQTGSVFQVCLGVDTNKADLSSFSEASRLIYKRSGDGSGQEQEGPHWHAKEIDPQALAGQELEVSLWSKEDPGLAPKGGAVVVIRAEADFSHFAQYRPAPGKRTPAYGPYKARLAEALVKEASLLVPGLENAVLVMDVATPLTFEERGGRSEGAVAGWSWDFEDNPDYRPKELVRTPIQGLYMAGYQAYSALFMGGVPMALASGHSAAQAVLQGAAPVDAVSQVNLPGAQP